MGEAFVLRVRGLRKDFRGFTAVGGVDLDLREGAIHALIGPNGAGKTTVFNLVTKFLEPSAGTIHFRGEDITRLAPAEVARRGLVRSFQISSVFPRLTVMQNVRIALQRPSGLAHQFWQSDRVLDALNGKAAALASSVGLDRYIHLPAGELPYGRKRALELATTLATDPDVLLLDEPMAGMAYEDIPAIAALIRKAAQGRTVLMVEHNLGVVADLCDRITVLQRGQVLAEGTYAEVSVNAEVRRAYIGEETDV